MSGSVRRSNARPAVPKAAAGSDSEEETDERVWQQPELSKEEALANILNGILPPDTPAARPGLSRSKSLRPAGSSSGSLGGSGGNGSNAPDTPGSAGGGLSRARMGGSVMHSPRNPVRPTPPASFSPFPLSNGGGF